MAEGKSRLDREARVRMHSLMERFSMPTHLARMVACGERDLSDALLDMQRDELADRLLDEGRIDVHGSSLIRQGRMTPDEAQFKKRLRDHKTHQGYTESRLDGYLGQDVVLALLGGRLVQGRLTEAAGYEIALDAAGETLTLPKHDLKIAFLATHRKRLLKRGITWGAPEARLEPGALRHWGSRQDIKARELFAAMEGEGVITWVTAEGDQLRGRTTGFNRYEVVLETAQGAEVLLFRHAFGGVGLKVPGP